MDYTEYQSSRRFALASMILGICSLLFFCTIYLPLPLGALGCLFAILSRRRGKALSGTAIAGLVTSCLGAVAGLVMLVVVIFSAITLLQPSHRDQLNALFEQTYGMDFEDYIETIYGEDFDMDLLNSLYGEDIE